MLHLVSGTNSLSRFVHLILLPVPSCLTYLLLHPSLPLLIHHCWSTTPSLFYSWLKTSLLHKSSPHIIASSFRIAFMHYFPDCFFWATRFLGRLFDRVDLIKPVSYVRPSVRTSFCPQKVTSIRFQWNSACRWRSMSDAWRYAIWPDPRSWLRAL